MEHSAVILIAGGVGGFAYWLSTYPADVIKSAMQSDDIFPEQRRYRSTRDCIRQLWEEGGWRRFYRGLAPCLIRSIPANAACFWAYEYVARHAHHPAPPLAHRPSVLPDSDVAPLACPFPSLSSGQARVERLAECPRQRCATRQRA